MSGIVAAAQSVGCCCRPQEGCLCTDPNRSGAVIDRDLTAISVDSEMSLEEAERSNGCSVLGCTCLCTGMPIYGSPGGVQYGYDWNGEIIDPDFTEGTECEGRGCTAGCCGGCPVFSVRADFGTCVAEQDVGGGPLVWKSVTRLVTDNVAGTWNWVPQQVGSCAVPANPLLRIRKYCPFSYAPGYPTVSGSFPIDPNGQYVNMQTGLYTGANIGLLRAYKAVEVSGCCGPLTPEGQCGYRARIAIGYLFQYELQDIFANSIGGVMRGIPLVIGVRGIVADYVKPCVSPSDTVMGTYRLEYQPDYDYNEEDPECGRIRWFRERFASFPSTLTVS